MGTTVGVVVALVMAQSGGESLLFPERRGGMVTLSVDLAGFTSLLPPQLPEGVRYSGVGVIGELSATWHAPAPFALRLRGYPVHASVQSPSGFAWLGAGASLEAQLDLRFFAAGAGVGFATFAHDDPDQWGESQLLPLVTGLVRLGALDGLHLQGRVHFRHLAPAGPFWLAGLEGTLLVPLVPGWSLLGRARFLGDAGVGDVGVRVGLAPSMFLSLAAGLGLTRIGMGPSVAVGFEYRL